MSDVFISYAREDRERAQALATVLQQHGLTVWWDRIIPPGRQFDEVIEEQLDAARCVLVLWTASSATSKWVKTEAGEALAHDKLVPALLDAGVRLPLEFRRVQAADISDWSPAGGPTPSLQALCEAVANTVAKGANSVRTQARAHKAAASVATRPPATSAWSSKPLLWSAVGVAIVVIVIAAVGAAGESHDEGGPGPTATPAPTRDTPAQAAPAAAPPAAPGLMLPLRWRDYLFAYEGRLAWDGRTSTGSVQLRAVDTGSQQVVAQGLYTALLLPNTGNNRLVFYLRVPVQGDSQTLGQHTHDNNLVFERDAQGAWAFVRACMQLARADTCDR
jgi:TIR domain